ncbi:hypothetical protein QEO94_00010 [Kingella negevensis]|nr:hypothetical protein [Kingella negevensis]WII94395.1 hypothetical protein QEO94_00010 [Kingella negevensis]
MTQTFAQDDFNRKPIAEKIIKLLQSNIDVSPMVIAGGDYSGLCA